MEVSYNKLWKLMIDKGMSNKSDLRTLTGIGTNTLAKLSKNQQVSMEVLMKICSKLDCDISDICEFTKKLRLETIINECDRFICWVWRTFKGIYGCRV